MKGIGTFFKNILPLNALIAAILFGLASLFTIYSGVHFYLPGTGALSDPREIFNSLGAAITGPIGGFIIGLLSTISGSSNDLKLYVTFQHLISAVWIGWGYKKLVYEKYNMPYFIFGWLFLILTYSYIIYLPGLIILHYIFNSLFQELVGGSLTLWEAIIKLYSGWMPETIFTTLYTTLVLIALPEKYRKPLWGVQKEKTEENNKTPKLILQKMFLKNFIAIRLSIWFILLFSIPLVYLTIFNRNYFLEYFLHNEAKTQYEAAHHVAILLEKTKPENIPNLILEINKNDERTLLVLDHNLNTVYDYNSYSKENLYIPGFSQDQRKQVLVKRSGILIDPKGKVGIGFYAVKNKDLFVFSISPSNKYESDLNNLIVFIYRNLGLTLLIISLLSAGIIWTIIGKPLKRLREVADEIGKRNYDVPLDTSNMTDEIKSLAIAVNKMKSNIKIAENETNENELKFRLLFETANDAIFISRKDLFLDCNSKTLELFGCSRNEIIDHSILEFSPEFQSDGVRSEIKAFEKIYAALLDQPQFFEWTHTRQDGTVFEVEAALNKITLKNEFLIQTILRDITERKREHTALQLSEAKFKSLINSMQDLVYTLDNNGRIIGLYGMWSEMYGLTEELLLGKKLTTFLSPAEAEINDVACARASKGESVKFEWSLRRGDDNFFFESSLSPFFGSNNEIVGVVGVAREITERRKTEIRLRESEERYRKLFDFSPEPIIVYKNNKILFINSAGVDLSGARNAEEIIGREILDFVHPDFHSTVKERMIKLLNGIEKLNMIQEKFVKVDGSVIDVEASTISFQYQGDIAALVVLRDVTERNITENKLKEKELLIRTVLTNAPVVLWSTDKNGIFTLSEGKALESLGLLPGQVVGLAVSDIYKDYPEIIRDTEQALKGQSFLTTWNIGALAFEARYSPLIDSNSNISGTIGIAVEITDRKLAELELKKLSQAVKQSPASIVITDLNGLIEYINPKFTEVTGYTLQEVLGNNPRILNSGRQSRGFYKNMYDTLLEGNEWQGEFQNKKKSGELYWESASISPVKNESGVITHFLAVKEDITERKMNHEELIKSKQMAEEANNLKSSLLANMSHELRTPLNGILGFSQLLRDEINDDDQLDMIDKIMYSGKRLMNTLDSVLTLTELENSDYLINKSEVDLAICCKELKSLYNKRALIKNLELKLDLKRDSLNVFTDESIFIKTISSIIDNAIKYTHRGVIIIELTDCIESDMKKYAVVNITDTGIGIRQADQKIIFGEFKQLSEGSRRDFEGLGLGLSLANKMVKLIDGKISVQSEIGKGSKFTLTLPIEISDKTENTSGIQTPMEEEVSVVSQTNLEGHFPHVLLVEDNLLNIEVVQKFLSKTCKVFSAQDGLSAINMCKKNVYSLLMIDINLGRGMNGTQVLEEIKKLRNYENVPVIALTGYASESDKKEFLSQGFTHYLAKPFEKSILIKLIKNVLNLG